MASRLLRTRISRSTASRFVNDNTKSVIINLELKLRAGWGSDCNSRLFSSSSTNGSMFDFMDLTRPHTWYPNARKKRRKVIMHVGPTNSGKTYQALKQLESSSSDGNKDVDALVPPRLVGQMAKDDTSSHLNAWLLNALSAVYTLPNSPYMLHKSVYCGPLRLLAWEVAKRLNKANVPCDLITGQEVEEVEGAKHKAVTVEMAEVNRDYECAIIDEIQMIGCKSRGFSFTRALLGISADEVHLCGDPAAVPLVQEILKSTDDDVVVQSYERLSPLVPSKVPVGSFADVKTGDCIVAFSRREIYSLKKKIQNRGNHLCSVVYGSLPPETRTRQALMFNDASSNFDVLVASDAIGMGLNLNISRIIFSTMEKFDGEETRDLSVSEIKQIAGRAGRYGSKFPVGEVTCLHESDLHLLHSALQSQSPILERAGIFPTYDLLSMFSRLHPRSGLLEILVHFHKHAKLSSNYFMSDCEQMLKAAAVIDVVLPLGLKEKYVFCISPVDMDDDISSQGFTQFAQNYAQSGIVRLREIFIPGTLQFEVPKTQIELKELESIHKVLELYVWLSYRFDDAFPDRDVAASQKAMCSLLIEEFLENFGWEMRTVQRPFSKLIRRKLRNRTSQTPKLH